ncbi:hypothetical protein P7C73_g3751, partial [Tremellales sp. Uapishka_1]
MVSFRSLALLVLSATPLLPTALGYGLFEHHNEISRRAVGNVYTCQNVAVNVPLNTTSCTTTTTPAVTVTTCNLAGTVCTTIITTPAVTTTVCTPGTPLQVTLDDSICLCLTAGVLTPDSISTLNTQIKANGTLVQQLTNNAPGTVGYTGASLLNYITNAEPAVIAGKTSTGCTYPTGADPSSCSPGCAYTCPNNGYVCNGACVLPTTTCTSNVARRAVDDTQLPLDLRCPKGFSACLIPSSTARPVFTGSNFECIETSRDLESCGGCTYPLPGQSYGQDCTAIPHTSGVSCESSRCHISGCLSGFTKNGTSCVPTTGEMIDALDAEIQPVVVVDVTPRNKKREKKDLLARLQVKPQDIRGGSMKKRGKDWRL